MLQTIEFPAGVANLTPGLTDVDGDALTHVDSRLSEVGGLSGEGLKRWRLGGVS